MNLRPIPTLLLLVAALLANGCARNEYRVLDTPYAVRDTAGQSRHYRLYLPPVGDRPLPLLAYFHGVRSPEFSRIPTLRAYTGSPVEETGLIEFCRTQRIALLVPQALYEYTFLNCRARGWVVEKEMNGVEAVIDAVKRHYPIATDQVYLAGISAGAGFCHFLANHRPTVYRAIVSHSQGYVNPAGEVLRPTAGGPLFGVVFCYNKGDYPDIIRLTTLSHQYYVESGYPVEFLKDVPPPGHAWSKENNPRFWKLLRRLGDRRG